MDDLRRCRCGVLRSEHTDVGHRFVRSRRMEWAYESANEDPRAALKAWDDARPRTGKTQRARAAGRFGVGPSDLSRCPKEIEYRERPPDDYEPVDVDRIAAVLGSGLHDTLVDARRQRYPWRRFGVVVRVPGLDVPGEIDEYDPLVGRVVDYKTRGDRGWDRLGANGPDEYEWDQTQTYALGLDSAGERVTEVQLIYWQRTYGAFETFTRPYDRQAALAAVGRLHALLDALHNGDELPRTRLGPTRDVRCRSYCQAVEHCWNVKAADIAGRSPEGFTLLPVVDDDTVEPLLARYDELRAQVGPAEKEQAQIKTLLAGIDPGTYGQFTYRITGGRPKSELDPEGRARELEAAIRAGHAQQVVDLAWPERLSETRRSVEIKRIRAVHRTEGATTT